MQKNPGRVKVSSSAHAKSLGFPAASRVVQQIGVRETFRPMFAVTGEATTSEHRLQGIFRAGASGNDL